MSTDRYVSPLSERYASKEIAKVGAGPSTGYVRV